MRFEPILRSGFMVIFLLGLVACGSAPVRKIPEKDHAKDTQQEKIAVSEEVEQESDDDTPSSKAAETVGLKNTPKITRSSGESDLREKIGNLQVSLSEMVSRFEALETKLGTVSTKLDSTRVLLDNWAGTKSSKKSAVMSHPADRTGREVLAPYAENDPEYGYSNDESTDTFKKAAILFKAGQLSEAILAFSSFVDRFPDHPLAGNAQFFLGESYFRQKEYKLSLQEFQRVLTSYDRSPYLPDTLKRMAEAEEKLNRTREAEKHRQLLSSLFPHSPAATKKTSAEDTHSESPKAPAAPSPRDPQTVEETVSKTAPMVIPPTTQAAKIDESPKKIETSREVHSAYEEVKINERETPEKPE